MVLQKQKAWTLFVLLSTFVCCQPTELILGYFCGINSPISLTHPPDHCQNSPTGSDERNPHHPQRRTSQHHCSSGGEYYPWQLQCKVQVQYYILFLTIFVKGGGGGGRNYFILGFITHSLFETRDSLGHKMGGRFTC